MANGPGKYNYLISGLQVRILLGAPIKRSKEMDKFKIGDESGAATHYFKKAGDSIYEDQWHLSDGKVTIPDDADKLEKDGSVVAFRKRKAKPFEFGDKVKYADGTIYIFVRNTEHGWCYGIKETHQCCTTLQLDKLTKI